jgi:hypothetical protein
MIILSISVAVFILQYGLVDVFLHSIKGAEVLGSFIAGLFFTSALTIAPASVILAEIAEKTPLIVVATVGAAGAVIGDLIMFIFIRDYIAEDLAVIMRSPSLRRISRLFKAGFMKHLIPVIGALIIASPLPDEIGLAMMGLSKTRIGTLVAVSYVMNFIGIVLVGLVGVAV